MVSVVPSTLRAPVIVAAAPVRLPLRPKAVIIPVTTSSVTANRTRVDIPDTARLEASTIGKDPV